MKKVDLNNLPKQNSNAILWRDSVGCVVKFEYDDTYGELEITGYKSKGSSPYICVRYKDSEYWISASNLRKARIGRAIKSNKSYPKKNMIGKNGVKRISLYLAST